MLCSSSVERFVCPSFRWIWLDGGLNGTAILQRAKRMHATRHSLCQLWLGRIVCHMGWNFGLPNRSATAASRPTLASVVGSGRGGHLGIGVPFCTQGTNSCFTKMRTCCLFTSICGSKQASLANAILLSGAKPFKTGRFWSPPTRPAAYGCEASKQRPNTRGLMLWGYQPCLST